jgi:hypothetical protein
MSHKKQTTAITVVSITVKAISFAYVTASPIHYRDVIDEGAIGDNHAERDRDDLRQCKGEALRGHGTES